MKPVVVIGSSNTDMVVKTKEIPVKGQTVLGGGFFTAPGGKGANQAVAAAKAGAKVTFVAKIGKDLFGAESLKNFIKNGVDTRFVTRDAKEPSGTALIFVDKKGQNVIVVASGANFKLLPADVKKAEQTIKNAACVVLQLESPMKTVEYAVNLACKHGVPVILNPAPARKLPDSLLKKIDIINPNETETEIITGVKLNGKNAYKKASELLRKKGVKTALITLGSKGVYVSSREFTGLVPALKVKPVDTTAAGDAFTGGLASALAKGFTLKDAVSYGNTVAGLSVTKPGAQSSMPSKKEIEKIFKKGKI